MAKKKPQMVPNASGTTHRYFAEPDAHLAYQTALTKTGQLNMLNRKPTSTGNKYNTLADGTKVYA